LDLSKRDIIINFIEKNPYCIAQKVVDGVKDDISRQPVFDILKELANDNVITNVSENRRDNKYVLNKNNEFYIIKKVLTEFKKAYYNLLKISLEHPDFVNVVDKIDNRLTDDKSIESFANVYKKLIEAHHKSNQIYAKRQSLIKKSQKTFSDLNELSIPYEDFDKPGTIDILKTNRQKIEELANQDVSIYPEVNTLFDKYSSYVKRSGFFALKIWPMYLYMLLVYFINLKSVSVWPDKIKDKEVLVRLNNLVYNEILELNSELISYNIKSNNVYTISKIAETIEKLFSGFDEEIVIRMVYDYSILNMKNEIMDVIGSLNNIRGKDVWYDEKEILYKQNEISKDFLDILKQVD
jgi:hypothetical protein